MSEMDRWVVDIKLRPGRRIGRYELTPRHIPSPGCPQNPFLSSDGPVCWSLRSAKWRARRWAARMNRNHAPRQHIATIG